MGRIPTFRDNFDDLLKLSLADLKRLGYMVGWYTNALTWTCYGHERATINITVDLNCLGKGNYVQLNYKVDGQRMNYRVELVQLPSNLGKGHVWYFICPLTGKRCRTLYSAGKYFASREALPGTLYKSQTRSKQYRCLDKTYGPSFRLDEAFREVYSKYAKKHYRGKPTPKMLRALKLERATDIAAGQKPKSLKEYFLANFT